MRFWLDRGVDGFRIDVAHAMAKPDGLPDLDLSVVRSREDGAAMPSLDDIRWDRDGVHDYHRIFRRVLDSYPGDRMAVGEAWVPDSDRLARYVRSDELNLAFNFELVESAWGAKTFRDAIERSLRAMSGVGAPCTWVLDNHDVDRAATRFGGGEVGVARARAAALMQLSLPGAAYIYNGDELGLANVDLPDGALQDPTWERTGHTERGRDGERVPLPWSGTTPPFGFSSRADELAADAAGVGHADGDRAGGRPRLDAVAVPAGAGHAAGRSGPARGRLQLAGRTGGLPGLPPRRRDVRAQCWLGASAFARRRGAARVRSAGRGHPACEHGGMAARLTPASGHLRVQWSLVTDHSALR